MVLQMVDGKKTVDRSHNCLFPHEDVEMSEEPFQEYEDLSGYGEELKDKT